MKFTKGYISWNKGMKGLTNAGSFKKGIKKHPKAGMKKGFKKGSMPDEWKTKISLGRKGKDISSQGQIKRAKAIPRKEKHWKWIEDRSLLSKKQERGDYAYAEWRRNVWLRDNFKCKIANNDCVGRIEAHHILSWRDYPELRYQVNNGITLCHAHHPRKRAEEKRLISEFQKLVSVSKV